ncbi:hypothetical protein B9Z65_2770 [Elsinoe australis]|uniref:Eisosome protein 1 n=1 Tax=Elsinoe australis TaxID=40998 RepID=A0A2P8A4I6_9PEZI|nr:hypothetical protein B9Z65_2770 [Elsinoe australis]
MSNNITCPDPSVHRNTKLQEQASTAALLASSPSRNKVQASDILDKDNKLSSRSAAMSLKHARPEDLPSYPSTGGVPLTASNGAANLANTNHKQFEHWKPDASSAAGKAALLAKDYKMAPLWHPELSAAGSKAALLAAKDGGKVDLWTPEASAAGNSAATQAFKNTTLSPTVDYGYTQDGRSKALLAATKSVSRARSGSVPAPAPPKYPDSSNSAYNALNAATKANRRPSTKAQANDVYASPAMEESRIKHLSDKISREMFTEHPPVDIEVQEKKHQDALRASAISMAKGMYDLQQRKDKEAASPMSPGTSAATAAAGRTSTSVAPPDLKQQAMQYIHLQEAAHKLAEERLAKMDPDGAARYREHYGYPLRSPRRKLSMKDRVRRRANSDTPQQQQDMSDSDEDDFRSRRIRNQMSQFNKDIEAVDQKKRQTDRAALLAAAEKKVQAQMKTMDDKLYAETGKVSQAKQDEWDAKAREKATRDSAKRTEHFGKQDIGGGRYMEQSEIEAIAAARLKPTLDEINENAEKRRARDEEIRLDQEEKKRQEMSEKQKERESKMLQRQTIEKEKAESKQEKDQLKAAQKKEKAEKKAAAKMEKEAEKARKTEEKRAAKEEKRRSKDVKRDAAAAATASAVAHESTEKKASTDSPVSPALPDTSPESSPKTSSDSAEAADDQRISPVASRTSTGEAVLHPGIERHVTTISTSSSEDAFEDSSATRATETPAIAPPTTVDPSTAAHKGTDGPIGTAPAIVEPGTTNHDGKDLDSPKSPKRISRLFDRFKRKSKHERDVEPGTLSPDIKSSSKLSKSPKSSGAAPPPTTTTDAEEEEGKTSATIDPTESDLGPLSAVEANAIADEHHDAAAASPSSFVRGTPKNDDGISELSSLTSDEPGEAFGDAHETAGKSGDGEGKEEKRRSFGLGIGMGKSILPSFGRGKGKEKEGEGQGEKRMSLDSSARSPVRETRFQEEL